MRQGICFCDEPHKSAIHRDTVSIAGQATSGIICLNGDYGFDGNPDPDNLDAHDLKLPIYVKLSNRALKISWQHDEFAWCVKDASGQVHARIEGEAQNPADCWGCWEI